MKTIRAVLVCLLFSSFALSQQSYGAPSKELCERAKTYGRNLPGCDAPSAQPTFSSNVFEDLSAAEQQTIEEEVSVARKQCEKNYWMAPHIDCVCYGEALRQKRLSAGPAPSVTTLQFELTPAVAAKCPGSAEKIAAYHDDRCAKIPGSTLNTLPINVTLSVDCGCRSDRIVEVFLADPRADKKYVEAIADEASQECLITDASRASSSNAAASRSSVERPVSSSGAKYRSSGVEIAGKAHSCLNETTSAAGRRVAKGSHSPIQNDCGQLVNILSHNTNGCSVIPVAPGRAITLAPLAGTRFEACFSTDADCGC